MPQRALALVGFLLLLTVSALLGRAPAGFFAPGGGSGASVYLSDLSWERTMTEWVMVSHEGLPSVDSEFFTGGPLAIGEQIFAKGLGVLAPSEIVYRLDSNYQRLEAQVGVQPDALPGRPGAQFLVYADGVKLYESPVRFATDPPLRVSLPLFGVNELRLVTVRAEDATRAARVAWADARLLQDAHGPEEAARAFLDWLKNSNLARQAQRAAAEAQLSAEAGRELRVLVDGLGGSLPREAERPRTVVVDEGGQPRAALVNNRMAVLVDLGAERHGAVSIVDVEDERYIARDLGAGLEWTGGSFVAGRDTRPAGTRLQAQDTQHPVLGPGTHLTIPVESRTGAPGQQPAVTGVLELMLFTDQPVLLSRFTARGVPAAGGNDLRLLHLDAASDGGILTGERTHYLAELTRLRHVVAYDDGLRHQDPVAWGKPVYLWDDATGEGLLAALLSETPGLPVFSFQKPPGNALARAGLRSSQSWTGDGQISSGWLYLERLVNEPPQQQFRRYRAVTAGLFPAPDLPDWFKYQWLSWYVYYMDITEDVVITQIETIAEHFSDLGPWHIIVDAGWYIAEGRERSEWRNQDFDKFPRGVRWLVDYAHSRGIKVVLYYTAPYLNNREESWNWLGLRGIIEDHPDWLIPLDDEEPFDDYAYDFQNPELREYMAGIMRDFMVRYNVDGIKLDGLGSAGESVLFTPEGANFTISERVVAQTMEIYRFVWEEARRWNPDVYIESGWINPVMANPYAHTFRYGDEEPLFTRPYPLPGFTEHIDYSAYQQGLLGQRSNMGAIYGEPNESQVNLWWLGATLAMGTQVSMSLPMELLTPESISLYRSFLVPYRPFEGVTTIDEQLAQRVFHTQVDGTWYVGLLNREASPRRMTVDASSLGQAAGAELFVYDVDSASAERLHGSISVTVEPESFRLLVLRTQPGIVWANSRVEAGPDGYLITAPPTVPGRLRLYAPEMRTIYFNSLRLEPSHQTPPRLAEDPPGYTYDDVSGLVTVWYPPGGIHLLTIE